MNRLNSALALCICALAAPVIADQAPAAAPPPSADTIAALHAACDADVAKLCPGVQPGGGRILACLKEHRDAVSDTCKQAILQAMQAQPAAPN